MLDTNRFQCSFQSALFALAVCFGLHVWFLVVMFWNYNSCEIKHFCSKIIYLRTIAMANNNIIIYPKYLDMLTSYHPVFLRTCKSPLDYQVMYQKCCSRMENSVNFDQTAPLEKYDLGLHSLLRPACPNILNNYGTVRNLCLYMMIVGQV